MYTSLYKIRSQTQNKEQIKNKIKSTFTFTKENKKCILKYTK